MAYTGAWKRAQRSTPPNGANPNLGDQVDDLHLHPHDFLDPFPEPTPNLPTLPEYMYAADDFMLPSTMLVQEPMITEPLDHDHGAVQKGDQTPEQARISAYHAHMEDYGAAAVHHASEGIERNVRDTYRTARIEMPFPSTGSRAALTRGRNAWPENNPDGQPAQGHFTMRWIDRVFARRQARHDMMPLQPYVAGNAIDIVGASGKGANQYTSPYSRLANARQLKLTTPQVRRTPRPFDDTATVDGTADPQYAAPVYWDQW